MTDITTRKTRSGRTFATWDGSQASVSPSCALDDLLQSAVQREDEQDASEIEDYEELTMPPAPKVMESVSEHACPQPHPVAQESLSSLTGLSGRAKRVALVRRNRQAKRQRANDAVFSHHHARPEVLAKYVSTDSAQSSTAALEETKVTSTGYIGLHDMAKAEKAPTLEDLIGPGSSLGFKLVRYKKGTPVPIVSSDDRKYIIAVMADTPNDADWPRLMNDAAQHMEQAQQKCQEPDGWSHRRGHYASLRCGVSHGGGQVQPGNLVNQAQDALLAKDLNSKEPFIRLSGFATSIMATWNPKLYSHYVDKLGALHARYPTLQRNFSSSVFAAATYNLGPQTASVPHVDHLNLAYGWCAITALGEFDYRKGGHLVLWDAGLVIEFPAGTTMLIPSAVIRHSNIPISYGERRYSFTQYSAGGLFRWVENGFRKSTAFWEALKGDPPALLSAKAAAKNRWKRGLQLWSTMEDLDLLSGSCP